VRSRVGQHPLEPDACGLVVCDHRLRSRRQTVADTLELAQREQARAAAGAHTRAACLQRGDLGAQIGASGSLVDDRGVERRGHPPIGARGFAPQKICVPSMPTR
jgi:hypothetical protein